MKRQLLARAVIPLVAVLVLSAAAGWLLAADAESLLDSARQAYEKHNYKDVIDLAGKALAASPGEETARAATRLRVLAACKLERADAGDQAAEAMAKYPALKKDPDLRLALADWQSERWQPKEAYETYLIAVDLYADADQPAKQAEAYFGAAKMLLSDYRIVQAQQAEITQPSDGQESRRESAKKAVEIYERIVALEVPDATRARARYQAGQALTGIGERDFVLDGVKQWRKLAADYPKTDLAPEALYNVGEWLRRLEMYVEAAEAFRRTFTEYPGTEPAKKASGDVKEIEAPRVELDVEGPFLPDEKPEIHWAVRNVRKLHFRAWPIDLTEVVARVDTTDSYDPDDVRRAVMATLGDRKDRPASSWQFDTPDDRKHQWHAYHPAGADDEKQTTVAIRPPLTEPGAYFVQAEGVNPDNEKAASWCVVIISRIAAVARADADQTLVMVGDAVSGEPVGDAKVVCVRFHALDRQTGQTNDAGLAELSYPREMRSMHWLTAVRKGEHQALCAPGSYRRGWWGYSRDRKVYGFTERPVYRPGDTVHFKHVIRRMKEGEYVNVPDAKVTVSIGNPKGEIIYTRELVTDEYGTIEGDLSLAEDVPLGVYWFDLRLPDGHLRRWELRDSRFRVEEYRKPEFKVSVEPARPDYRVGEEMKIRISAQYYFGEPVVDGQVDFTVRKQSYHHDFDPPRPWGWYYDMVFGRGYRGRYGGRYWHRPRFDELVARGTTTTDANGDAYVTLDAEPIKNHEELDIKFVVDAEVTDPSRRVIRAGGEVKVTHQPFFVYATPARYVYGPGDSVEINLRTENPNGQPVAGTFEVVAWRVERERKGVKTGGGEKVEYEEKLAQKLHTETVDIPETGRASLRFVPDVSGQLKIIVRRKLPGGAPDDGKPVTGECYLWVAAKTGVVAHYDFGDLQLVPSADQYEIGETMRVLINTRHTGSTVLLTGEAGDILFHRVIHVEGNSKLVEIPVERDLTPNFTLQAVAIRDNKLLMDEKKIIVPPTHQFLNVELTPGEGSLGGGTNNKYQPREKVPIDVKLTDVRTGEPVVGEVALFMVDSSVYYIQPEFREAIEKAFYGYVRGVNVATSDSFAGPGSLTGIPSQARRGRDLAGRGEGFVQRTGPMADMVAKTKIAEEGEGLAETIVRERFADTVLWAGSVVTDEQGCAQVTATMPDQLTTFALHGVAVDKQTRVGQSEADVITTKRIIVRIQSGRFFTEGDRSYVTLLVHNYFDQPQELVVDLAATDALKIVKRWAAGSWAEYASGEPIEITVPAGGEQRIDVLTEALRPGEVAMTARARGKRESDAMRIRLPILEWGARKISATGGALRGDRADGDAQTARFTMEVPEQIKPGSQRLTVTLNPSVAAVAMDALPYLADYPYGCVEQTMSRFLPTVTVRKTLQQSGVDLDEIRKLIEAESQRDPKLAARYEHIRKRMGRNPVYSSQEMDKMVSAGLKRLADMQHNDGGWGWWKRDSSDPYMTAYVVYGLIVARDADVKLPGDMLRRGLSRLKALAARPVVDEHDSWWIRHVYNDNTRAYMLHVISLADPKALTRGELGGHLERLWNQRDDLTDYGRSLLAMTLHAAGRTDDAKTVIENFQNTAVVDADKGTVHWGRSRGWWYWYHGGEESTAWAIQAMVTVSPEHEYLPMAVRWLVENRRDAHWRNTKTTAMVVYALMRYAKHAGELDCDQTYEVAIGDGVRRSVRVTRENLFTFDAWITIDAGQLPPGAHEVTITRRGKGNLYWTANLQYFTTAERITGGGNQLTLDRRYFRLVPEEFTNTRRVWKGGKIVTEEFPDVRYNRQPLAFGEEIRSGELVEVEIAIDAERNLEYMVFEDPKPAGCEPYRLVSGRSYGGGTYANMELRDTKVAFFASWIGAGERTLSYRLVCEQPGTFRILPSSAEAMYSPFIEAISDSGKLTIVPERGDGE